MRSGRVSDGPLQLAMLSLKWVIADAMPGISELTIMDRCAHAHGRHRAFIRPRPRLPRSGPPLACRYVVLSATLLVVQSVVFAAEKFLCASPPKALALTHCIPAQDSVCVPLDPSWNWSRLCVWPAVAHAMKGVLGAMKTRTPIVFSLLRFNTAYPISQSSAERNIGPRVERRNRVYCHCKPQPSLRHPAQLRCLRLNRAAPAPCQTRRWLEYDCEPGISGMDGYLATVRPEIQTTPPKYTNDAT